MCVFFQRAQQLELLVTSCCLAYTTASNHRSVCTPSYAYKTTSTAQRFVGDGCARFVLSPARSVCALMRISFKVSCAGVFWWSVKWTVCTDAHAVRASTGRNLLNRGNADCRQVSRSLARPGILQYDAIREYDRFWMCCESVIYVSIKCIM